MSKVVVRVDSSDRIGAGHVTRCIALVDAMDVNPEDVLFLCRQHPGDMSGLAERNGYRVSHFAPGALPVKSERDPIHCHWIGAGWDEDAAQTRACVAQNGGQADWLIVDHYGLDRRWESEVRACARRILVVDDLADRDHDCDLLLDMNVFANMDVRYRARVPASTGLLLGPNYALLQREYARLHRLASPRQGPARRILAFFGGADCVGMTERFLRATELLGNAEIEFDVVLPFSQAGVPPMSAAGSGNVRLHSSLPTLARLMESADLAVGAGGVSNWERMCLGLPSLVIATAENQRPIAEELGRRGLVCFLGWHEDVDASMIASEITRALQAPLYDWSLRCLNEVDGVGAVRVAAAMRADSLDILRIRPICAADEHLLLEWANDPVTRENAFSTARIGVSEHAAWFMRRLLSQDCRMFIAQSDAGVPVGQVRFERESKDWTIGYSIAPTLRGRGLGRRVLAEALSALAGLEPEATVVGMVKPSNLASRRVFESLGFYSVDSGGALEYRCDLRAFARSGQ